MVEDKTEEEIDLTMKHEAVPSTGAGVSDVGPSQPALELGSRVEVKNEDEGVREIEMNVGVDMGTSASVDGNQPCVEEPKPMAC